jgi:hypothetical protein
MRLDCKWNAGFDESKEHRTPKYLLQYIHRLRITETFTIEDTKLFGKLHFHSTEPGSLVIFSAKKPTKQLLCYGTFLMRNHS